MLPMVLSDIGEISSAQEDGAPPVILAAGAAPGESGVSIVSMRYARGAHFAATFRQHVISFVSAGPINCRFAGTKFLHKAQEGSLAISPAGVDCTADTEHDFNSLLIVIRPRQLSLAAAEATALEARLLGCLPGHDQNLLDLARALANESQTGYPHGPLGWNETAARFIDALVTGHILGRDANTGGMLDLAHARADSRLRERPSRRAHRRRHAGGDDRPQPVPFLPRVHSIRGRQPVSLRRASPIASRRGAGPRTPPSARRDCGEHRIRRSKSPDTLGATGVWRIADAALGLIVDRTARIFKITLSAFHTLPLC